VDLRPLATERDGEAARLLSEAFFDYPTWDALAPRAPARRRAMIARYYGTELAVARRWGGTILAALDGQELAGVVLAFDPGRYPPPAWSLVWFAPLLLASPSSIPRSLRALSLMDSGHPRTPHLFLHTVGADPGHQRRGVGRALISAVLERADGQRRPAYLMTSRPELVGYYGGFGFDSVGQLSLPRGVTAWQMLRDPE
jgi:GNAT superfamily N-acetyltransferase